MTTQDLGQPLGRETALDDDAALGALFASSPASSVHTSAAAEIAFVAGLLGVLAVPFSLTLGLSVGLAAVALVTAIAGMARSSRADVAGGLLAATGLVLSLATLAVFGLRYLGIDISVGDSTLPTLADWLRSLNDLLPRP